MDKQKMGKWSLCAVAVFAAFSAPETAWAMGTGFGAIPQISNLVNMITGTITGPVAYTVFFAGAIKAGGNVYRQGGIQGLADGGLGIAAAGFLLGNGQWLAAQLGLTGALIP